MPSNFGLSARIFTVAQLLHSDPLRTTRAHHPQKGLRVFPASAYIAQFDPCVCGVVISFLSLSLCALYELSNAKLPNSGQQAALVPFPHFICIVILFPTSLDSTKVIMLCALPFRPV